MPYRIASLFVVALLVAASFTLADEPLAIGHAAPDWAALKGTDGKLHSLADFKAKDVLVIVFTCNSCPYANDYEERLIAFAKEHCGKDDKVALVAINANKVKEDLPEEMKKRAEKQGYNFPYVWDETQATARAYGATYTPEFYVLDQERKLVYRGAFDDSTDPNGVKQQYVVEAVKATLAGGAPKVQETQAVGCAVRYERSRRGKK
jgi:peroxiredoxin